MDLELVELYIAEGTLYLLQCAAEQVNAQLLEASTCNVGVEVDAVNQRVDLNRGLGSRRQSALGTLASCAQTTQSALVASKILLVLALELLNEVVDHSVVEVLTAEMRVSSRGLDLERTHPRRCT